MSEFVLIHSKKTVRVTRGLDCIDNTNYNSDIPNRINVRPNWTKSTVVIKEGQHAYPSEVAQWNSVLALQKDKILTIGSVVDETSEEVDAEAKEKAQKLEEGKKFEDFNKAQNDANKAKRTNKKPELKEVDLEELSKEGD